VSFA
jgi:hypothetical protein